MTEFVGFEDDETAATILEVHPQDDSVLIITDRTPFYAEMGGQAGDTGTLSIHGEDLEITGTQQIGKARAHIVPRSAISQLKSEMSAGDKVILHLNTDRRRPIEAHHTATHLLHWALHETVSKDATQQGSAVDEHRLRFDFNSAAVKPEQIAAMEEKVNSAIQADDLVSWTEVKHASIKGRADIMQFFGDKYGENVRVVQIGGGAQGLDGYSMELCGGTHVRRTSEVGLFKIKSEGAIASGVRRIEAVCGDRAVEYLRDVMIQLTEESAALLAKLAPTNAKLAGLGEAIVLLDPPPLVNADTLAAAGDISAINQALANAQAVLDADRQTVVDAEKRYKKLQASQAAKLADEALAELISKGEPIIASFEGDSALLQELQNGLKKKQFTGPALLIVDDGEKLHLATHCGADALVAGLKAGDLLREFAAVAGGKGGGKPDQARGAAPDRTKLDDIKTMAAAAFQ